MGADGSVSRVTAAAPVSTGHALLPCQHEACGAELTGRATTAVRLAVSGVDRIEGVACQAGHALGGVAVLASGAREPTIGGTGRVQVACKVESGEALSAHPVLGALGAVAGAGHAVVVGNVEGVASRAVEAKGRVLLVIDKAGRLSGQAVAATSVHEVARLTDDAACLTAHSAHR